MKVLATRFFKAATSASSRTPLLLSARKQAVVSSSSSSSSLVSCFMDRNSRATTAGKRHASTALVSAPATKGMMQPVTATAAIPRRRTFASSDEDSHDDFAPKRKAVVDDQDAALDMIKEHVTNNRIMLYMKGSPSMPLCGFSAQVVRILQAEGVDFASVNVLDYPSIREGVKAYSDWPTIPQLYVNGEFVGGCDIVSSMHDSGELKELLNEVQEQTPK